MNFNNPNFDLLIFGYIIDGRTDDLQKFYEDEKWEMGELFTVAGLIGKCGNMDSYEWYVSLFEGKKVDYHNMKYIAETYRNYDIVRKIDPTYDKVEEPDFPKGSMGDRLRTGFIDATPDE